MAKYWKITSHLVTLHRDDSFCAAAVAATEAFLSNKSQTKTSQISFFLTLTRFFWFIFRAFLSSLILCAFVSDRRSFEGWHKKDTKWQTSSFFKTLIQPSITEHWRRSKNLSKFGVVSGHCQIAQREKCTLKDSNRYRLIPTWAH